MHLSRAAGFAFLLFVLPLLFFASLEAALRFAPFGYPPSFLLTRHNTLVTNEKFGWRFFPRRIARTPAPEAIRRDDPRSIAVVLGESAAMGFPDPALGPAAYLQSALGPKWRVVNAAMTAINSHAVREIANEMAELRPSVFIVYMGNNEVVGPFGAASVFGQFSNNLSLIRANLWARHLRMGQLVEQLISPKRGSFTQWRGLEFFEKSLVPAGDPRLERVYAHFRSNLADIVAAGQRSGAKVIVSTVAVNLQDCPPFSSSDGAAGAAFAAGDFSRARDLDQLRFRADSRLNATIRETAAAMHAQLIDAEKLIEPTRANFWEHVHLRPDASRRLAESWAAAIRGEARPAATLKVTAWDERRLWRTIRGIVERPPFRAEHLRNVGSPPATVDLAEARTVWSGRVTGNPEDLAATERLAELEAETGNYAASERLYRNLLGQIPLRAWHTGLGESLLRQGRFAEATASYAAAIEIDAEFASAHLGAGVAEAAAGHFTEAERALRQAIQLQPALSEARNSLGRLLESQGKLVEAEEQYRLAIQSNQSFVMAHYNLGGLLARKGNLPAAIEALRRAIEWDPAFAAAHYDLGLLLAQTGQLPSAIQEYESALRIEPRNADTLNNLGSALARSGKIAEARQNFQAALSVNPQHQAAKKNMLSLGAR